MSNMARWIASLALVFDEWRETTMRLPWFRGMPEVTGED